MTINRLKEEGFVAYGPNWKHSTPYFTPTLRDVDQSWFCKRATLVGFTEKETRLIHAGMRGSEDEECGHDNARSDDIECPDCGCDMALLDGDEE